jgi:hypothetical protein
MNPSFLSKRHSDSYLSITNTVVTNSAEYVTLSGSFIVNNGIPPYTFTFTSGYLPKTLKLPNVINNGYYLTNVSGNTTSITGTIPPSLRYVNNKNTGYINTTTTASLYAPLTISGNSMNIFGYVDELPTYVGMPSDLDTGIYFPWFINVTDSSPKTLSTTVPMIYYNAGDVFTLPTSSLTITTSGNTGYNNNTSINLSLQVTDGTSPYLWSYTGNLPTGIIITNASSGSGTNTVYSGSTLTFSGTLFNANPYPLISNVLIAVSDSAGNSAYTPLSITTNANIPIIGPSITVSGSIRGGGGYGNLISDPGFYGQVISPLSFVVASGTSIQVVVGYGGGYGESYNGGQSSVPNYIAAGGIGYGQPRSGVIFSPGTAGYVTLTWTSNGVVRTYNQTTPGTYSVTIS